MLEFPSMGWLLAIGFAVPALISTSRIGAIGGLLTGIGAGWLVLLGRVSFLCRTDCEAPGIESWLLVGGAMLVVGLALTAAAALRSSRSGPLPR